MFSIIIPTLNNLNYLKICINSLKKNSSFKNQIIVHVNIGEDGTIDFLKQENIEYTFSNNNLGLCKAVNIASKKAVEKYIVYSHDDFYFCPNWDNSIYEEIIRIGHKNFIFQALKLIYLVLTILNVV